MLARVNGEEWSRGSTSTLTWSLAEIVAYASRNEIVVPGQVIGSGTVGLGCGLELFRKLKPGDVVELEIEGIGTLRNTLVGSRPQTSVGAQAPRSVRRVRDAAGPRTTARGHAAYDGAKDRPTVADGRVLWSPSERFAAESHLSAFITWLRDERGLVFEDYDALWRWSVDDLEVFWLAVWDFFDVPSHRQPTRVLAEGTMPGASWFEGARLNYAEMALAGADDRPAITFEREDGSGASMTRKELAAAVGSVAAALRGLGVGPGDRVAAYLPNIPEAVIAFLASASIGAVWSSCSPDFGAQAVIDRFQQIEPSVLFAVESYRYGGSTFDRRDVLDGIADAPSPPRGAWSCRRVPAPSVYPQEDARPGTS